MEKRAEDSVHFVRNCQFLPTRPPWGTECLLCGLLLAAWLLLLADWLLAAGVGWLAVCRLQLPLILLLFGSLLLLLKALAKLIHENYIKDRPCHG